MSQESQNGFIDEELLRQLTLEYPERCRSCDKVASTIVLLMVRGNRTEAEVREAVMLEAEATERECRGRMIVNDPSCFGDATKCYLNTDEYIESTTTIVF